ncbi:MAG: nucleolar RNA-binding Nop10p family protein [Candidatus Micrarchaeia archaeon]
MNFLKLKKCRACGVYTLAESHCGSESAQPHPAKYSPADKYASYRRKQKYGG